MLALIRSEWRFLLFGFLLTFWSSPGQTFFISLFSGELRADLGLSDGEFGAVYSLATLASAIVMVWSGSLVDRVDLGRFARWAVCGLAAGCLVVSFSNGIWMLIVGIFLLRQMGQGLMSHSSSTAMVRYLHRDRGKASALASMGYAVSEAVMPILVVTMIALVGWRQGWQVTAVVLLVLMLPVITWLLKGHDQRHADYERAVIQEQTDDHPESGRGNWTRSQVLRDPCFYGVLPGLMSQQLMFTGFIFHQVHLVGEKGWSPETTA